MNKFLVSLEAYGYGFFIGLGVASGWAMMNLVIYYITRAG